MSIEQVVKGIKEIMTKFQDRLSKLESQRDINNLNTHNELETKINEQYIELSKNIYEMKNSIQDMADNVSTLVKEVKEVSEYLKSYNGRVSLKENENEKENHITFVPTPNTKGYSSKIKSKKKTVNDEGGES
ncbi:MAG: hypothetical protein ACOCQD_02720 [archaeon]